jgi:hypothetical protein
VHVVDLTRTDADTPAVVATYRRNFPGTPPFEPFRQGDRHYALISPEQTRTAAVDLHTGQVVAWEEQANHAFYPVGFYVPDWLDVHDGTILPGDKYWDEGHRWPDGTVGFVWGCVWGDDNDWKVQALDLSGVPGGVIKRDDRFGYLRLADIGTDPREFIQVAPGRNGSAPTVRFAVPRRYTINGTLLGDGTR